VEEELISLDIAANQRLKKEAINSRQKANQIIPDFIAKRRQR